ncbi:MAG: acyltransferase family protein [Zhongshania sp.]|uniref:acyltransferase family protein n=1 Tax=Zhongshania sp. TaxID=1971902 RepID=UPI00262A6C66|nr:acyltransferase family protein [Zhongshania sp.]MDF1694087.1 acyltransferase family protein [Zhongshania sp.]
MKYRAEIDGLRAVAVIPVILFHAGFGLASGGFVGVDIFFVISGYLITTLLIEDIENKRFSIVDFYERRARRILPALLVVMLCCTPFAWALLPPQAMKDFSQSLVATASFSSNILFWLKSGYFDSANELKPLLHTWSLAVEEQYYVLFPLFLVAIWRLGKARVIGVIAALALASLALSEWGWRNWPTANFYLAPTRVWELFAGAITVFIVQRRGIESNNAFAFIGLAALVFSIFFFDENTPFPSVYALLPVLGVVLILIYGNKETYVAKLLSTRLLVGIGLISYSAYLWHQPVFAFYRHATAAQNTPSYIALIGATILLAYLSWRYIEQPFRSKTAISRTMVFSLAVAAIVSVCLFGVMGSASDGFAKKRNKALFKDLAYNTSRLGYVECPAALSKTDPTLDYCHGTSEQATALVVGDSHADDKFYGIAKAMDQYQWQLIGNSSCPPLVGVKLEAADGTVCTARLQKIFNYIETQTQLKLVVLSFAHSYPLASFIAADHVQRKFDPRDGIITDLNKPQLNRADAFYGGLANTLTLLQQRQLKVVIAIDIPELRFFPLDCIKGKVECVFSRKDVLTRQALHRSRLAELADRYANVSIYDPSNNFCEGDNCSILRDGHTLYRDSHHLSLYGSQYYGKNFAAWFKQAAATQ